jgi:UDP-N-acetyl-D-glucosamine dehydrogenase
MNTKEKLIGKIEKKQAVVGVIGLGYVGLPLVLRFARAGFNVVGFDVDSQKTGKLNKGVSYIHYIENSEIKKILPNFRATIRMEEMKGVDAIVVCVPTPLDLYKQPELKFLKKTAADIYKILRKGQIVSVESTTYPGTTREIFFSLFEKKGLKAGRDYYLVYSPEREDPGNPKYKTEKIPKLVGGITGNCRQTGVALYSQIIEKVISVSSPEVAESSKLLENIYRAVNIALVNELKLLFEKMDIDIWEVIKAAGTKPFGFHTFYPGPGLGGHCIPIDPFYLTWKAKEYDFPTRFVELAGEINSSMPYHVVEKCIRGLNDRGKSSKKSRILIIGITYKKDVDDARESPAFKIMKILREINVKFDYYDPYIPEIKGTRQFPVPLKSIGFSARNLKKYDAGIIVTDHSCVDYSKIASYLPLIIDTRNVYKKKMKNVLKA